MHLENFARSARFALLASYLIISSTGQATVLTVDPNSIPNGTSLFSSIASAANFADADSNLANTYDIQITPGTYTNDFANVTRPMTIEAIGGSGVTMQANGQLLFDKGIIVTTSGLTVNGITFEGAAIDPSLGGNGAGIRDQSPGSTTLDVENSKFIGNQDGILTAGSNNQETVKIINSQFLDNGSGTGQTHALYVGDALSLLVEGSTFCGTNEGHNIKSRAMTSTITGTTSYDGAVGGGCTGPGTTSYGMEFPNGGIVNLVDDTLIQGDFTHNSSMLGYGAEGFPYSNNALSITDSSFTSDNFGTGIQAFGSTGTCTLQNASFTGVTTPFTPGFCTVVSQPTGVDEPSFMWLTWMAVMGWTFAFLVMKRSKSTDAGADFPTNILEAQKT
jgi:hypothetical protein